MLFVCQPKILHKHCFQLLGGDKQRALWYVLVFSVVVNQVIGFRSGNVFYVYIGNKFYLHITLNFDKHKHIAVVASLHMTQPEIMPSLYYTSLSLKKKTPDRRLLSTLSSDSVKDASQYNTLRALFIFTATVSYQAGNIRKGQSEHNAKRKL